MEINRETEMLLFIMLLFFVETIYWPKHVISSLWGISHNYFILRIMAIIRVIMCRKFYNHLPHRIIAMIIAIICRMYLVQVLVAVECVPEPPIAWASSNCVSFTIKLSSISGSTSDPGILQPNNELATILGYPESGCVINRSNTYTYTDQRF